MQACHLTTLGFIPGFKFYDTLIACLRLFDNLECLPVGVFGIEIEGIEPSSFCGVPGVDQVLAVITYIKGGKARAHELFWCFGLLLTRQKAATAFVDGFV